MSGWTEEEDCIIPRVLTKLSSYWWWKAGSALWLTWIWSTECFFGSQLPCEFLVLGESWMSTKLGAVLWKWSLAERLLLSPAEFSLCHHCYDIGPVSALTGGTFVQQSIFSHPSFKMMIIFLYFAFLKTYFSSSPKAELCPWHLWFLSASDLISTSVTILRVPAWVLNQLCWLV